MLRTTFALYRQHSSVVLGISAVCAGLLMAAQLPFIAINHLLSAQMRQNPGHPGTAILIFPLVLLATWIVVCALYALAGGSLFCLVMRWRQGEAPTVSSALNEAGSRFGSAFGAMLLISLRLLGWYLLLVIPLTVVLVIILGVSGLAAAGQGATPGVAFFAGFFLVGVAIAAFFFWLLLRYSLTLAALYAERTGAGASIRRSIELTRGGKGRLAALFGILLLLSLVFTVVLLAIVLGPMIHEIGRTHALPVAAAPVSMVMSIVQLVISFLFSALVFFPIGGVGLALCYLDLRARKDMAPQTPPPLGWAAPEPPPYEPTAPYYPPASPELEPRKAYVDSPRSFRADPGRSAPEVPAEAVTVSPVEQEPAAETPTGSEDPNKGLEPPHEGGPQPS